VLTFNLHHGRGADGTLNLNRIAEVIQESKADVIGLNEVDRSFSRRSDYMDQIRWLSDKLNMYDAFGPAVTLRSKNRAFPGEYGNALLSRFPVVFQKNHRFHSYKGIFEGRALLETEVQMEEKLLKIFVTHLSLNPWKQNEQVEFMLKKLEETRLPVILLGDYNMRPGTRQWKKITSTLTDVCHFLYSAPCNTFPSTRPRIQLDYIFVSKHFLIRSVQFIPKHRFASDHIPIKATLKLQE
jgi:endonuclease/exonuclease/phosphatase family metal-dependent hydrolase